MIINSKIEVSFQDEIVALNETHLDDLLGLLDFPISKSLRVLRIM